jgi:SAM-dependent methyltransferase
MFLRNWLDIEFLREMDLDDPRTTVLRRRAIHENANLKRIYSFWYDLICPAIPSGPGHVVELGSGAGFLSEHMPNLIASEIFYLDGMHAILDGQKMPFAGGSLNAIVMTNVLHHIPSVRTFFSEATRVVRPGGVISMIEPWASTWSKLVYTYLHHEHFDMQADSWEFPSSGPLSGAHQALPWIIFQRDRDRFLREFPAWKIDRITPIMPVSYLFSGGFSIRPLFSERSFRLIRRIESLLSPLMSQLAMFAHILLRKQD